MTVLGSILTRSRLQHKLLHTHIVILLADELVEEGEVGAIEAVPAHRAGHTLLVVKPDELINVIEAFWQINILYRHTNEESD